MRGLLKPTLQKSIRRSTRRQLFTCKPTAWTYARIADQDRTSQVPACHPRYDDNHRRNGQVGRKRGQQLIRAGLAKMWNSRQADNMLGTARGKHSRGNSLYEKIARRDSARAKRRWLFSLAGLCSATFLFWLFHRNAATSSSEAAVPKQKIAFVVLTDPRENHEENVIPMLRHVEQKYGKLYRSPGPCI